MSGYLAYIDSVKSPPLFISVSNGPYTIANVGGGGINILYGPTTAVAEGTLTPGSGAISRTVGTYFKTPSSYSMAFVSAPDPPTPAATLGRTSYTFAVMGEIKVASGDTDFIPPFFVSVPAGMTATIVKVTAKLNGGTSVTAKLQKNGVDLTGYTAISVTTTAASTTSSQAVVDGDKLALVATAVSGTPKNLSFSVVIEYS